MYWVFEEFPSNFKDSAILQREVFSSIVSEDSASNLMWESLLFASVYMKSLNELVRGFNGGCTFNFNGMLCVGFALKWRCLGLKHYKHYV